MVYTWDSLSAWARATDEASRVPGSAAKDNRHACEQYYRRCDWDKLLKTAIYGDDSAVPEAERVLSAILDVPTETTRNAWIPSVGGAFAMVPEFLAGAPDCMRRLERTPDDRAPISVYAALDISASLSPSQIRARGVSILALILRLQSIRPVRLFLVGEGAENTRGPVTQVIPIESQPMNLAVASNALSSEMFTRALLYTQESALSGRAPAWSLPYMRLGGRERSANYCAWMRAELGAQPQDIYIPPTYGTDPLLAKPVEWINEIVNGYIGLNESENL